MCGIVGWLDWERDLHEQRSTIEAMARTLAHRGPDGEGFWISPTLAFAHRRLIVIDPSGGKQPMVCRYGDRTFVLTHNGEIYNFIELRRELETLGHVFESRSDTEVILRGYVEWGPACVERLNGIFAFGIWDEARKELFLARDHLGVKPLYYAQRKSALLFASELKALLRNPLVSPEVDAEGLAEIIALGTGRTPDTGIYRGVKALLPGHAALVDQRGMHVRQYWKLENREHKDDLVETTAHVRHLLVDAVERQLVADVPICSLLSGGVDSSGVVAIAATALRRTGKPLLDAYSIDFVDDEKHFQGNFVRPDRDLPWARRVSEHVGIPCHDVVVDIDNLIADMLKPLRARDLPSFGESDTSLLLLFQHIKSNATVVLSGEGADEVFSGYFWHYMDGVSQETFPWPSVPLLNAFTPEVIARIRPIEYAKDRYTEALSQMPRRPEESGREARLSEIYYLGLTRFLGFMLDRKDRMSMAASIEARVPFCDHRLVEYVWNVPREMKRVDGIEKGLLRRGLSGLLPEDVLRRRKAAYPLTYNPAYVSAMGAEMLRILDDPNSSISPLINTEFVRQVAERSTAPGSIVEVLTRRVQLEQLIQIHHWLREYGVVLR
jgi:asparagine synthase (glutamine-hydrolysing)